MSVPGISILFIPNGKAIIPEQPTASGLAIPKSWSLAHLKFERNDVVFVSFDRDWGRILWDLTKILQSSTEILLIFMGGNTYDWL